MMGLTRRQSELLQFIRAEAEAGRNVPTYVEIARHIGVSSRGRVCELMKGLEERGAIRRHPRRPRSVEIVDPDDQLKVNIRPAYWDALVKYADLTHASIETAVNQAVADMLENP